MVQAPVTKITGTFEPGHGMAQWFSRSCVHRWGRARRHKLTTAPNQDLQIEDWPEEQLAEKRQQSIAIAIMENQWSKIRRHPEDCIQVNKTFEDSWDSGYGRIAGFCWYSGPLRWMTFSSPTSFLLLINYYYTLLLNISFFVSQLSGFHHQISTQALPWLACMEWLAFHYYEKWFPEEVGS